MTTTDLPYAARQTARFVLVVVFEMPPFWLKMATIYGFIADDRPFCSPAVIVPFTDHLHAHMCACLIGAPTSNHHFGLNMDSPVLISPA
ncbi:hypothetical protein [Magnetospirillum aberrantis]|uniref:Uncharacterized protein n=1 Tax=Magnetospirillum aberrantis SpK TaxID=908842 RepID=A0A7C9QS79_9PROT|nr:hypothetical protein [Magnetospirillum aberrantis]NFV79102.1 hypothetical protein [Magnetospirillum aberrantis SpK]